MEISKIKEGILDRIGKYKYVLVVVFAGIVLMMIPGKTDTEIELSQPPTAQIPQETDTSMELAEILMEIQGAGKVKVLLSVEQGERTIYQADSTYSENEGKTDTRSQTVLVTDSNRNETGLVYQKNPPVYLGAVVLAQGAENPQVKLALVDAVSKATGLGADKISVLKMK